MKKSYLLLASAAMCTAMLGGCATTAGSGASNFAGLMSNFQETQAQFDGTFYETLDMATIGDGHVASEDMEVRQFLSQGNFGESNEFLGTIHTSLHVKDGTFVNLVNSQAVMVPLAQVRDQLLAQWTGPQPEDIVIVVSDEMGYEGRALKENVVVLPIGALLDIAFGVPGEGVDGTEQGVDPKVAALDRELAEKYGLNLAVVAEEGELPQPSTQSELAAFMAHELSHILLGHYQRGDGAVERERINNSMTGLTYVGIALGGARVDKVNDQYEVNIHNEARSSDLLKNAMIASAVAQESNRLLNASASREQEDHADLLAVDLVSLANYNPAGVKAFLGRETVAAAQAELRVEDMSEAQTMLASQLATSLGAGQGNFLNDMAATFAVSGFQNVMNRMSSTHRSNEKRLENVTNYLIRLENDMFGLDKDGQPIENPELVSAFTERVAGAKYLEDAQVPSAQLEALRNPEGEAFRVLKAYNDTREAKRLLAEPDKEENVERAGELLRKARLGAGKREAAIVVAYADYLSSIGEFATANQELQAALQLPGASPINYVRLADSYIATNNDAAALQAIERGEALTGTRSPFFPLRITYHYRQAEYDNAVTVYEACKATESEIAIRECDEAMIPVNQHFERLEAAEARRRENEPNPFGALFGGN